MLYKLRRRAEEEKGFTLIELLVVILIIGILAAIAIPSFLNQKGKANDASAKELVRTAATAMETYATQNNGSYASASPTVLNGIEGSIATSSATANGGAWVSAATGTSNTYTVVATAPSTNDQFTITNGPTGSARSCSPTGSGCTGGTW
jgi:type IV pilus assembly protein PilA